MKRLGCLLLSLALIGLPQASALGQDKKDKAKEPPKTDSKNELKPPYSGPKPAVRARCRCAPPRAADSKSGGGVKSCPSRQFAPSAS